MTERQSVAESMARVIVLRDRSAYVAELEGDGQLRVEAKSADAALRKMRRLLDRRRTKADNGK